MRSPAGCGSFLTGLLENWFRTGASKLAPGLLDQPLAELVAQEAPLDFLDVALRQLGELKRPVGDADQPDTSSPSEPSTFLTSRFLPSLRPIVSQAFEPCSRSSVASIEP